MEKHERKKRKIIEFRNNNRSILCLRYFLYLGSTTPTYILYNPSGLLLARNGVFEQFCGLSKMIKENIRNLIIYSKTFSSVCIRFTHPVYMPLKTIG